MARTWPPFKFSGKESLAHVGLDLYGFGARMYTPSNMRWLTMDPLCEKYYSISPYAYCAGDPVNRIDPDGMAEKNWIKSGLALTGKGLVETAAGIAIASSGDGAVANDENVPSEKAYDLIKDGPISAVAKGMDMATETDVPIFEIAGSVAETTIGLSIFTISTDVTTIMSNVLTIGQVKNTIDLINDATSANEKSLNADQANSGNHANNIEEWSKKLLEIGLWNQSE